MPKLDLAAIPLVHGTNYPAPYDTPCLSRIRQRLGDAAGLTQFGVNLLRLPPGAWSSQRHRHSHEDELVYLLRGEVVLVTEAGEQPLRPGDCAAFASASGESHHLQNRSGVEAVLLEIGARDDADTTSYPGLDLAAPAGVGHYVHLDGTPYPPAAT